MQLLSDERSSRVRRVFLWLVALWCVVQVFENAGHYMLLSNDLVSLGQELNVSGEDEFRRRMVEALEASGVAAEPTDIGVAVEPGGKLFAVSAPCRWRFNLLFRKVDLPWTMVRHVPRWETPPE